MVLVVQVVVVAVTYLTVDIVIVVSRVVHRVVVDVPDFTVLVVVSVRVTVVVVLVITVSVVSIVVVPESEVTVVVAVSVTVTVVVVVVVTVSVLPDCDSGSRLTSPNTKVIKIRTTTESVLNFSGL